MTLDEKEGEFELVSDWLATLYEYYEADPSMVMSMYLFWRTGECAMSIGDAIDRVTQHGIDNGWLQVPLTKDRMQ